jgi:hypothetical protein
MLLWRALQVIAFFAIVICLELATRATPLRAEGWNIGRLLYAGSGIVAGLSLFALAALGEGQRRIAERLSRIEEALHRRG